jgi:hypothetical protein
MSLVVLVIVYACCRAFGIQWLVWKGKVVYCLGHDKYGPGCFRLSAYNIPIIAEESKKPIQGIAVSSQFYRSTEEEVWKTQLEHVNKAPTDEERIVCNPPLNYVGNATARGCFVTAGTDSCNLLKTLSTINKCLCDPTIASNNCYMYGDLCSDGAQSVFTVSKYNLANCPETGYADRSIFKRCKDMAECKSVADSDAPRLTPGPTDADQSIVAKITKRRLASFRPFEASINTTNLEGTFLTGIPPEQRDDCVPVANLKSYFKDYAYDALYYCSDEGVYWSYGNFESSQNLERFEEECKRQSLQMDKYTEQYYWNDPIFNITEKECKEGELKKLYPDLREDEETICRKLYSCENLAKALDIMYPDQVKLEAAIVGESANRDGFIFTFKTGILSILIGSWAGSATVLTIGLISQGTIEAPLVVAVIVALLRMLAMYLRTRNDLYDRQTRIERDRTKSTPKDTTRPTPKDSRGLADVHQNFRGWRERYLKNKKEGIEIFKNKKERMSMISRLILHISKPYSVADIMTALALAGINIFRAVQDGKHVTQDGGPMVILSTIVSLSGIARSTVVTGKNAEACFALLAMSLTPLSPTAGGAITLLASAWLESSLTGTQIFGQVIPWYRIP